MHDPNFHASKINWQASEAGLGAVAMMRAIKQALDPLDILNPGKIFRR